MTKDEIKKEAEEIYFAIKEVMEKGNSDYCLSWWLNTRNFSLKSNLSTSKINQRAKLLVKEGYLTIDKDMTGFSTGTCYRLTDKVYKQETAHDFNKKR